MAENSGKLRWMNVILFFSLALNFFTAGYLVSDLKVIKEIHTKKAVYKRPEIRIVDYFSRQERKKFRKLMYAQRAEIMPVNKDTFKSQKEIFKAISEKQINELRLRQAFRKYQNTNDNLHTAINDIVIKMVLEMDYQARRDIVERGKMAHAQRLKVREKWLSEHRQKRQAIKSND